MEFVIERDVPIPPAVRGGRGKPPGPVVATAMQLEIGESFRVEGKTRASIQRTMVDASRDGLKFVARRDGSGAYRVWRTA